jgi:hypothetical protein
LVHTEKDDAHLYSRSDWVLMTRDAAFFARPEIRRAASGIEPRPGLRLWTDDYNNLLQVLRF